MSEEPQNWITVKLVSLQRHQMEHEITIERPPAPTEEQILKWIEEAVIDCGRNPEQQRFK